MHTKRKRARPRVKFATLLCAASATAGVLVMPWSDSLAGGPAYSVDWNYISAGTKPVRNSCYLLSGTAGQTAPGYSSSSTYAVLAGFWAAAPTSGLDEIFFNGFQGC